MKYIAICLLIIDFAGAQQAQAATQNLYCISHMNALLAEVSTSSNYVSLKNARLEGAFIHADLTCSGNETITGVHCSGYLNDRILILGKFIRPEGQPLSFSYSSPTNGSMKSDQLFVCTLK